MCPVQLDICVMLLVVLVDLCSELFQCQLQVSPLKPAAQCCKSVWAGAPQIELPSVGRNLGLRLNVDLLQSLFHRRHPDAVIQTKIYSTHMEGTGEMELLWRSPYVRRSTNPVLNLTAVLDPMGGQSCFGMCSLAVAVLTLLCRQRLVVQLMTHFLISRFEVCRFVEGSRFEVCSALTKKARNACGTSGARSAFHDGIVRPDSTGRQ